MVPYDATQKVLAQYLSNTELLLNKLLEKDFAGSAQIKFVSDLGFPHDVIRIAGGFATGAFVCWSANRPFVPVDTCVNVCSTSFFEVEDDIMYCFNKDHIDTVKNSLMNGIYIPNFHRGNHFISYLKSRITGKSYLLLHSSANEYKENFNGLYPIENNWFFDKIKTFSDGKGYIRYIDNKDAEQFCSLAQGLNKFNELRHEFIAHVISKGLTNINNVSHYHHYGMPNSKSIAMGCHIISSGDISPVLTLPGEDIYMVRFNSLKDDSLRIDEKSFLTPHGWGKRHKGTPQISLDLSNNKFILDSESYDIKFGTSLRANSNLELRDFQTNKVDRKDSFFEHLNKMYDLEIVDNMEQIVSWNKDGVKIWK